MSANRHKQWSSREVNQKNKLEMSILLKSGQAVQKTPTQPTKQQKKQQINNKKPPQTHKETDR